jgi:ABC-type molybdate transport system substrate-binding protein
MARDFLVKLGIWDEGVAAKRILITGNAVQGVLAVKSGSAAAALIPLSLAISGGGAYRILPAGSLPVVAGINAAGADPNAVKFFSFLRSPEALPVWERWGFRRGPR